MSKKQPEGIEIFGPSATVVGAGKGGAGSTAGRGRASGGNATSASPDDESAARSRRRPWLGVTAFVIAVALAAADVYAIVVAIGDYYELAIMLAIGATIGTIIAFLLGAAALVLGRGRWWGVAAMVLSVLANPFTLVQVLVFFSDFTAS